MINSITIFYFWRVLLVVQSLSLLFGVGSVILVWLIGEKYGTKIQRINMHGLQLYFQL